MQNSNESLISLSELMMAFTMALDMTEGQPPEHCIRCCWIGMHIGDKLSLNKDQLYDLFFTLLLKDAGCSSNAARICELYMTDDLSFKRNYKTVGTSLSSAINFVVKNAGYGKSWISRISTTIDILKNGSSYAQELIQTRCTRGAEVARELRFSEDVAQAVHSLDEHWDGTGKPEQLKYDLIPLYSQIALISQVVDVFQFEHGLSAAIEEVSSRSGSWFSPALVEAFISISVQPDFCKGLIANDITKKVMNFGPAKTNIIIDDNYIDCIVTAFGKIVDSKSPYTAGHSERVALYTILIANELGIGEKEQQWLKRAALLHDLGKLGVSNTILDKPAKLNEQEWEKVQAHATLTEQILLQIPPFYFLAKTAGAHHEKLDGTGYPNKLKADEISLMTRIITTADIFDAITAERPYRGAIPIPKALLIMEESLHTAIDESCFNALKVAVNKFPNYYLSELPVD